MTEAARMTRRMSLEEYLLWEDHQDERHELVDGEVFAMVGGTSAHNLIALNVASALLSALRGRGSPCLVYSQGMKVLTPARNAHYPDAVVTCANIPPKDLLVPEPTIIVEVLSDSTALYDRQGKWLAYQTIPSLATYLLVSQDEIAIERYDRHGEGWLYRRHRPEEPGLALDALGITLKLVDFYTGALSQET